MIRNFPKPAVRFGYMAMCAGVALSAANNAAQATVILQDTYYGGTNTYNNPNDIIGDASVFDITSAIIDLTGPANNTLHVTIHTNFAGKPGTPTAEGTGYGTLFLTPGLNVWSPTGSPPHYPSDIYQADDWQYAFTIPMVPSSNSGTGYLYLTSSGVIQLANAGGNPVTYPFAGNPGFYFRQGQPVQFTPSNPADWIATGSWSVSSGKVEFDIVDNHLFGADFALSWAITCANDIIQGQVSGVPEPATWAMIICGFGLVGGAMRRRKPSQLDAPSAT
jgi:hypothetical protein